MKVPNPPGRGKDIAEGKGVRREEESEGSRLWDSRTGERLDKDRFRRDLGGVEDAYREIMDRLEKMWEGTVMTLEELRRKKRELRLTSEMIAEASGVPLGTVQKLFGGTTKAPRKRTVEAVEKALYLEELRQNAGVSRAVLSAGQVGEGAVPYPSAGEGTRKYTISGYYALPEEQRAELIDGIFYDMSTPAYIHQKILGLLHLLFAECTAAHGEGCEVCISPCDVRLDQDRFTMVQPDLMVLCRPIDLHAVRLEGAPDLVLEILSPSTRAKDQLLKLYKYQKAGVREYWIVDPEYRTVTVHFFEEEAYHPVQYGFGDVIPVGISGGTCAIDFSRVLEKIKGYYE